MRLHRLEVTAFGPFSGTESVDFDALTDAGLFLLCGPTGAGKTSILDAVCFGLYGEVPGDRNSAKRLRSDHAAPGVPPAVVLEVTIGGRRFRIHRSPAWQRPKRRGTGTTLENAKVTLEEHANGAWVHLSSRLDETGHLLIDLLGMNATQFCQVAMLPQGRFQSFLRARSDERHKVLQQLFRTGRFEDIERWLVAHRQSLKAASRGHQEAVASVVSRICEAGDATLPAEWELNELAVPAESGEVRDWARGLAAGSVRDRDEAEGRLAVAADGLASARRRLDQARTLADLRARHREAVALDASLREQEDDMEAARLRLDQARRAAAVRPLLRVAEEAARAATATREALGPLLVEAAGLLDADTERLTEPDLAAAEKTARDSAAVARALLPREAELAKAQRTVTAAARELERLRESAGRLEERCAALPGEIRRLRTRLEEQSALAAQAALLAQGEAALRDQVQAARKVAGLGADLEQARDRLRGSVDAAQLARETMHDIREARITGMAAELAVALAGGDLCPVCGSAEHPSPARPVEGAPTQADEQAAREAYEDADFERQTRAESVATLEQNRALALQASGGRSLADLEAELGVAKERWEASVTAGAEQDRLVRALEGLEREQAEAQRRLSDTGVEMARLSQEQDQAGREIDRLGAELSALFEDEDVADSVARLVEVRAAAGAVFGRARDALAKHENAVKRAADAQRDARECAAEHGFDSLDQAVDAVLEPGETGELEERLARRAEQRARVEAVLSDPAVVAAAAATEPELAELTTALRSAEDDHARDGARARVVERRSARLLQLSTELEGELDAWAPTRSAYAVAHAVSTFAEGKGGDNGLQMRLSAYVLASRLEQVVAAANERLHRMSDERYTLEHSSTRGVGELRGGLSLQVRDEWTGEARDPATLSGGETFVVSLSLALGLADVVTQEAGGTSIDTLFIDEGFGTLDPETLDDVMNTLDGLRDGGRVVGIVSHVPEMRTRVPAQLQVRKGRSGSHVVSTREAV